MRRDDDPIAAAVSGSAGWRVTPWAAAALAGLSLLVAAWLNAGVIEATAFPVLGEQAIPPETVVRTATRLCWRRDSFKHRVAQLVNLDVFLDRVDPATGDFSEAHRSFPEIFDADPPHDPVQTDRLPGTGWSRRPLCIQVPANLAVDQAVRLRQVVHFAGWLGLWELPGVRLPDIVDRGAKASP